MGSCQKEKTGFCCFGEEDDSYNEKVFSSQPRPTGPPSGRHLLLNTKESIFFKINGKDIEVDVSTITATTSLASYLRSNLHLTGTKVFCFQGGCGACIITASVPAKDGREIISANSCLTPLLSCDGWEITTVEGLGNRSEGLHKVQATLAEFSGTQCGYCSPGMVMQMNSLLEANPNAKMADVEKILDGNICRCTGYRPIFDAFKSLASDAPADLKQKAMDIEDLCCKRDSGCCKKKPSTGGSLSSKAITKHFIPTGKGDWYAPGNIEDLISVIDSVPLTSKYTFVGGNTGRGIYNPGSFDVYIDLRKCVELSEYSFSPTLTVGSAVTLSGLIKIFDNVSAAMPEEYGHCKAMANHVRKVANTGVRNIGTVAGNLMLKHAHPDFPSDLFTLFVAAKVQVEIRSSSGMVSVPIESFLSENMDRRVVTNFLFQPMSLEHRYVSYKITPRSDNAHAYVNAAFSAKVSANNFVASEVRIAYGGISADFFVATELENAITGKSLNDSGLLTTALDILEKTVNPTEDYILASVDYRKHLSKALYYKFLISVLGSSANPRIQSGATQVSRGMSSGKQAYQTDPGLYPVNMAMPKIEARSQCSGEAEYVNDIPSTPGELAGAFVLATIGNCDLDIVDPSPALAIKGVIAFYDYKSIPGINQANLYPQPEYVFCEGHVEYAGQAIGFVVAENPGLARQAAAAVKVTYKNLKKPVLTIKEALKDPARVKNKISFPPKPKNLGKDVRVIEGEFEIGSQFHFHLETQVCIVKPVEDHQLEIYSANQWMDNVQISVAKALNIPEGSIEVRVRRLGGAYGGKITPPSQLAVASALAAKNLRRPVRTALDLKTNMELVGKRSPYLIKYNAGVSAEGKLIFVNLLFYGNTGYINNESDTFEAVRFAKNCYASEFWSIQQTDVLTNTAANKACRAPGTTQGVATIEYVMEHIATVLGEDPLEFRLKNMISTSDGFPNPLPDQIIPQILQTSNYTARKQEIEQFNANNAWKKRGISLIPILYPFKIEAPGICYYFSISIYAQDGTIAISHGGHEMGQGINTKVVQTVAKVLGVPLDIIFQKPANTFVSPNSVVSGGSFTTDFICGAAITACETLKDRLQQVEATMNEPTWAELILECYNRGVDLTSKYMGYANRDTSAYDIWGCGVTEIEVDILTGEKNVRRVDLIEDTGSSVNPAIDIGQMEGAFVMSLGLWLSEQLKFDPNTGRLLTVDTWEYKPPSSHDIPEDFRVTFFNSGNSPAGVFGAKAIGEPAVLFGISSVLAIKQALNAGKVDVGVDPTQWFDLHGPATTERIQLTSGIKPHHFYL